MAIISNFCPEMKAMVLTLHIANSFATISSVLNFWNPKLYDLLPILYSVKNETIWWLPESSLKLYFLDKRCQKRPKCGALVCLSFSLFLAGRLFNSKPRGIRQKLFFSLAHTRLQDVLLEH